MVLQYLGRRGLAILPVLIIVATVSFVLVHLAPGDPAAVILGDEATPSEVAALRAELGLDSPLHIQYWSYISDLVRGNLGTSLFFRRPVWEVVVQRAEPTLVLATMSLMLAVVVGVSLGVVAALKRNSAVDQLVLIVSLLGVAMPNFWLGLNLILVFSIWLSWLPSSGYSAIADGGIIGAVRSLLLPAIALGFSQAALISRMTRTSMLEVLGQDFVRTARAKGLAPSVVTVKHALRNAMLPVATVIGISLATLLGGSVVVETVFALPGVGRLLVESVFRRDYPIIQGTLVLIAAIYVLLNLLVDFIYVWLDPRIKY